MPDPSVPDRNGSSTAAETMLPLLFGDLPLAAWPPDGQAGADEPPWSAFVSARAHLADGDQDLAVRDWASVSILDTWESRHTLQAWTFLRSVGVQPDASIAGQALGVVAQVAVEGGHDALAAYRVGGVRYLNHAGAVSVVEDGAGSDDVTEAAAELLGVAQQVGEQIGPWTEPALPELPAGHSRFTMLTPSGHRFGQGPDEVLRGDPMAGALFAAATQLLVAVVDLPR